MKTDQSAGPVVDRIEREIHIGAPAERVWPLIARPGWWINEGQVVDLHTDVDGDVTTVHHPRYGAFRIRTVRLDEPRYAAYRWLGGEAGTGSEGHTTLVEFWVEEQDGGGVRLRVVESGFASLPGDDASRRRAFQENDQGWREELLAARAYVVGPAHP